jgi:hypothetical protein
MGNDDISGENKIKYHCLPNTNFKFAKEFLPV